MINFSKYPSPKDYYKIYFTITIILSFLNSDVLTKTFNVRIEVEGLRPSRTHPFNSQCRLGVGLDTLKGVNPQTSFV